MFKIKIRPHKHNRYLYTVTLYERCTFLGMAFWKHWKWWGENSAIPDWGIDKHIMSVREKMKVTAIDFQLQEEFKP
jgi:hypothetical protein